MLTRAEALLSRRLSETRHVPVDLYAVCAELGLLEPTIQLGSKEQHGGLRRSGSTWQPVVYRTVSGRPWLTPRERFTLAHEIAHAVIEMELPLRPKRNAEYWALEERCDRFAVQLLVPENIVHSYQSGCATAEGLITASIALSREADVSLACAARRLVESTSGCAAWGLREHSSRDDTVRWRVIWDIENPAHFKLRRPAYLRVHHVLASIVVNVSPLVGDQAAGRLDDGITVACRRMSPSHLLLCAVRMNSSAGRFPEREGSTCGPETQA